MNRKQRERCEKAIETLKALKLPKGAKFDMETWGYHGGDHAPTEHNYCGTVACAAGWLSLDPWFRRRGMLGKWTTWGAHRFNLIPFKNVWDGSWSSTAAEIGPFFGLTAPETRTIFGPGNTGTAKGAARRFQRVLDARDRAAKGA